MKSRLKETVRYLGGSFLPKSNDDILNNITDSDFREALSSIRSIEYKGAIYDRINLSRDAASLNRDFNKAFKLAKQKYVSKTNPTKENIAVR